MISERKLAANRRNANKSCGPRTAAGKHRVSRNALRHGLAAVKHLQTELQFELDIVAGALCGDDLDQRLFEQARLIAESQLLLQRVRDEGVGLIERLRDREAVPLVQETWRHKKARIRARGIVTDAAWDEFEERQKRFDRLAPEEQDRLSREYVREREKLESRPAPIPERDDAAAITAVLPDVERLTRYERRAWARYRRALREFITIKFGGPGDSS